MHWATSCSKQTVCHAQVNKGTSRSQFALVKSLGIGGLVGSGRTEVARKVFGITAADAGTIRINDKVVDIRSAGAAMKHGIAYVCEDRLSRSLIPEFSIRVNGSLTVLDQCTRGGLLRSDREVDIVRPTLERLKLR